jgi:hypothetical protein
MLISDSGKVFTNPPAGQYIGVVADVVDLGLVKTSYGEKAQVRIVWLLFGATATGQLVPYNDAEGRQFRVFRQASQSMNPKAKLYETVRDIQNGELPSVPFESETLLGKSNLLYVLLEKAQNGKEYANIKVILPLPATIAPPAVPLTFVRHKDRDKVRQGAASNASGAAVIAAPTVTVAPAPAVAVSPVQLAPVAVPAGIQRSPVINLQAQSPVLNLSAQSPFTPAVETL